MPNVQHLRETIGSYLGVTLTPEVAARIEAAALWAPDESHEPTKFGRLERGEFSIQAERLSDILDELHPLHELHWLETEKHRHGIPLKPDYDFMLAAERAGNLIQFTVRRGTDLVGNLRMYVGISRHTLTLFGEEDTLFIHPSARMGFAGLALALMRFAESSLLSIGVQEIRADSKLVNGADVLMRRLGYTPVALKFVKVFKEHGSVQ